MLNPLESMKETAMHARMKHPVFIIPDAMKAMHALHESTDDLGLSNVTRELVHLRASQINGCSVCVGMHAAALKKSG
jgi:alkylhydroperoxidase family enzyme